LIEENAEREVIVDVGLASRGFSLPLLAIEGGWCDGGNWGLARQNNWRSWRRSQDESGILLNEEGRAGWTKGVAILSDLSRTREDLSACGIGSSADFLAGALWQSESDSGTERNLNTFLEDQLANHFRQGNSTSGRDLSELTELCLCNPYKNGDGGSWGGENAGVGEIRFALWNETGVQHSTRSLGWCCWRNTWL